MCGEKRVLYQIYVYILFWNLSCDDMCTDPHMYTIEVLTDFKRLDIVNKIILTSSDKHVEFQWLMNKHDLNCNAAVTHGCVESSSDIKCDNRDEIK